ncbi:MAG: hypothetical protein FWG68_08595 [Defluviitaleaceae bacterium]|nr:hypothetical protein [Defluviitaleaceae bacterium]
MSPKAEEMKSEFAQFVYDNHVREHGVPPEMPIDITPLISDLIDILADDDEEICKEAFPRVFARELEVS